MPILRDDECKKKSRSYLTKILIDFGADPNLHSPEVNHTPLHWLAFWGDHRAVRVVLQLNRVDFIQPKKGCCSSDLDKQTKLIGKHGAFNAFQTRNGQTLADIAGDLKNYKSLLYMVEYFHKEQELDIRNAFITPEIVERFEKKRFAQRRT